MNTRRVILTEYLELLQPQLSSLKNNSLSLTMKVLGAMEPEVQDVI
jgi:hypothetical protein